MDFDGTLAPINANPLLTTIDPDSERLLHSIAQNPKIFLAIISGRRSPDVKRRVGIENITYSGNHGLEIIFANQTNYQYPVSPEILTNCTNLKNSLAKVTLNIDKKHLGFWYDRNKLYSIFLLLLDVGSSRWCMGRG